MENKTILIIKKPVNQNVEIAQEDGELYNELHESKIKYKKGDWIAGEKGDKYPISKKVHDQFDIIENKEDLGFKIIFYINTDKHIKLENVSESELIEIIKKFNRGEIIQVDFENLSETHLLKDVKYIRIIEIKK